MTAVGLEIEGELIAAVLYDNYNGATVNAHVTIRPGAIVSKNFLWYTFHYPFNELKVNKILGFVNSDKHKALSLYKNLGFVEEHRITGGAPGGDLVVLSMTPEQCKFLGAMYEQPQSASSA